MRKFYGIAIVLGMAATLPASAEQDRRPVACVYARATRIPRDLLVDLVKNGFKAQDPKHEMVRTEIGQIVMACSSQFGWSEDRRNLSARWMTGRVMREDAVYQGKKFGLTEEMILAYVAKLDPAARAAYVAGHPSAEHNQGAIAHLKAAGLTIDTMSADDVGALGQLIGEGVTGTVVQQDSEAGFKR